MSKDKFSELLRSTARNGVEEVLQGFDLSDSGEARASYTAACAKSPLVTLIMAADLLASHVMST